MFTLFTISVKCVQLRLIELIWLEFGHKPISISSQGEHAYLNNFFMAVHLIVVEIDRLQIEPYCGTISGSPFIIREP